VKVPIEMAATSQRAEAFQQADDFDDGEIFTDS
jgi:hypothetical protein